MNILQLFVAIRFLAKTEPTFCCILAHRIIEHFGTNMINFDFQVEIIRFVTKNAYVYYGTKLYKNSFKLLIFLMFVEEKIRRN